ncbi:MAG: EamA family transporter [Chitinophagaceae bacterium]|nr:EamA family transporter [Chitinophagaceae bacterium]
MIVLFLSIICSTYLVITFRIFKHFKIDMMQGIVVNYITCVITGMIVSGAVPSAQIIYEDWFPFAAFLGCMFFFIFNMMAFVAANIGVTLTSVASKLSMAIPVTVAIYLYDQEITIVKLLGLLLAIVAVYLTSVTPDEKKHALHTRGLLLALIIFIGSGINDSIVNYAFAKLLTAEEFNVFNITIFGIAATAGSIALIYRGIFLHKRPDWKAVVGGILLGIPNFFSMYFLLKALNIPGWESSVIFPVNNMGIVVLTAFCGWLLFREHLSRINIAGIVIALLSIALMIIA